ncbi:hypothetical protein [Cellvibrio fontiphilus]|uniref:MAE-28990/MAE-18760-like HEPN domain-containing protein n=1 Tax=Cellvibrio fontiphilus TaxID=1815559 RepID=A0ABV7FDG4_9GAMM
MAKYKGWDTSRSLLIAYESMAMAYKKQHSIEEINADFAKRTPSKYVNYNHAFALLILNASIIEGILRGIISDRVTSDIDQAVIKGRSLGQTSPSKPEQLLSKFLSDIEMQGGWDKLKEQYSFYYDVSLEKLVSEEIKEGISSLFVLRNVLAHGTTLIQPSVKMDESLQDTYPYNWQRKLQRVAVYLEKQFSKGELFENLAEFEMPSHFFEVTKQYIEAVEKRFSPLPQRIEETIKMVKEYSFGYINYTR